MSLLALEGKTMKYTIKITGIDLIMINSALKARIEHDAELMAQHPDLTDCFKEGQERTIWTMNRLEAQTGVKY